MPIKLRPHHLLCTQSYQGKGYSKEFVENMDDIVKKLRSEEEKEVTITFSTDDICAYCPCMSGIDLCSSQEKVKSFDKKAVEYFAIKEKTYIYKDIIQKIDNQITPEIMDDICKDCKWYYNSFCKEIILAKKSSENK